MQSEGSNQHGQIPIPSRFDQAAFNYTRSQAATSYAGSMSGTGGNRAKRDDDDQSKASFYTSYTEASDADGLVRREGNRTFNTLSETYSLPTDINEWDRLDKQHRAITLSLGGLYPAPEVVRAILAPEEGVTKKIVDLGCGTGIWSTEMAREFPHCEVLGIDLAPVPIPPENLPPNCRFEMDNINLGLPHLKGEFNVVFARAIALGLKDFRKSLTDAATCLKPGGILIWIDADYSVFSGWPMVYRPFWSSSNPGGSYLHRVGYEMRRGSASLLGCDVSTMEKILDEGFWSHSNDLDPNTCKTASLFLPIGTWCDVGEDQGQQERLQYVGLLMRQDISEAANTALPFLIKLGWSKETSDRWVAGMKDECQRDNLGFRFRVAWGRRRAGPDLPAPALREVPISEESQSTNKYMLYEVFDTQEQALAAVEIRARGKDISPPPLPSSGME